MMPGIIPDSAWQTTTIVFVILITVSGHERFGLPSTTLHIAEEELDLDQHAISGGKIYTIHRSAELFDESRYFERSSSEAKRVKRSADYHNAGPKSVLAHLGNDSHTTLIVHWAGEGSDVILALAKNSSETDKSSVYVSYDYGKNFTDFSSKLVESNGNQAIINKYFTVNKFNSYYVFTDLQASCIFTTDDSCRTFATHCGLPFKPRTLSIHRNNPRYMLGLDEESNLKQLYLSGDFGSSWTPVLSHVKAFYWDFPDSIDSSRIYVQEEQPGGKGQVVRVSLAAFARASSRGLPASLTSLDLQVLLTDVVDFQIKGEYIFATKSVRLFGSQQPGPTMQLWISHKGQRFYRAEFPHQHNLTDFYVADASEGQLMVCISHNASYSNLYISDVNSYKFSLSLEKIFYFNPKVHGNSNWIRSHTNKSFADVTKISGVQGIYIASQQVGSYLQIDEQISVITYDKGGMWQKVTPPELTLNGRNSTCASSDRCSLHLMQRFHQLLRGNRYSPILTQNSAPGLVVASGVLGSSLKGEPHVFVSASAGIRWTEALPGSFAYATADQGGIIAAIHLQRPTNQLLYSIDEGETWHPYMFTEDPGMMRVYGLMTEPGENTTIFTVFGSPLSHHRWSIIQVDMKDVFRGKKCTGSDYKKWSVSEDLPSNQGCLLGRVTQYQRRLAHVVCYNGKDFVRKTEVTNCMCTREDFECDYGYSESSIYSTLCERDSNVPDHEIHQIPQNCPPGTFYNYTRGYRKVPGDTCHGGQEHNYGPLKYSCPVKEQPEFLLVTSEGRVGMLNLGSGTSTRVLDYIKPGQAPAVFDLKNDAVLYVSRDGSIGCIESSTVETSPRFTRGLLYLDPAYPKVASLAFDWTGRNVFTIMTNEESGMSVIVVINVDHRFHKKLYTLHDARSLVLDPHDGFLYFVGKDVSTQPQHYSIYRASMDGIDGSPILVLDTTRRVGAETVMTLDRDSGQLFWIDSESNYMYSGLVNGVGHNPDLDGTSERRSLNLTTLLRYSRPSTLAGASAIAIHKDYLYVSFRTTAKVLMTRKSESFDFTEFAWYTSEVVGMVVVSNTSHHAMSACSPYHGQCSQLCLPRPAYAGGGHNRTCRCDDEYRTEKTPGSAHDETCLCEAGDVMKEGVCYRNGSTCASDYFTCSNGRCVSHSYKCDGDDDCHDGSDELDCVLEHCKENSFTCHSGKCIPANWRCDGMDDCRDGMASDELRCANNSCSKSQFTCANHYCINKLWKCDGDNDCHDNSDEQNCDTTANSTCADWEFTCADSSCVDHFSHCNGMWDCQDGSDERNCTQHTCTDEFHFSCGDVNNTCILKAWLCDHEQDCSNGKDEENCPTGIPTPTTTASPGRCISGYRCHNNFCVGWETLCNGVNDCGDGSDEEGCFDIGSLIITTPAPQGPCLHGHFSCDMSSDRAKCLPPSVRCNGQVDCTDGTDEEECEHNCSEDQFDCEDNSTCVWRSWVCDGDDDCRNGKDEEGCEKHETCESTDWRCAKDGGCVPITDRCNGVLDCDDASDELGCDDIDCSILDSNLEGCCAEEKCGVYLHQMIHFFFFMHRLRGKCKPIEEAAANVDHNLCATRVPEAQYNCKKDQFSCQSDRHCLSYTQVCNRHKDCDNNHDERNCDCPTDNAETPLISHVTNTSVTWIVDNKVFSNFSYALLVEGIQSANLSWTQNPPITDKTVTVSGLKAAQAYSFVFKYKDRRCLTSALSAKLEDGLPSAPQNLVVTTQKERSADPSSVVLVVKVQWKEPASPRGTIKGYVIYYQQINNNGTTASDVFEQWLPVSSGQDLQDTVVAHIERGRTYHFWVAAMTEAGVGEASAKQTVNVSPGPEKSFNPKIKILKEGSVNLLWNAQPEVKGYKVTVEVEDPVARIPEKVFYLDKSSTHQKIRDLCPGSHVTVKLAARYGDSQVYKQHDKDVLTFRMDGTTPKVNITNLELNGPTQALLSYKVVQGKVQDKYWIFYTHEWNEVAKNISAMDTTHLLRGLYACERYFVWVRPSYPTCPVGNEFRTFVTQEDPSAPLRDVEALTLRQNDVYHVRLTWKTSCGHLIINTSYIVSVQAGEEPEWSFVQAFSPSEDGQISWLFREVSPGVTYKFTVRSDVPGSRPSEQVEVTIPSLDGPINLVMFPEEGHSVMVRWDWPPRKDFPEFKEYILHTSGPDSLSLTNHTSNTEISLALGKDGQYNFTVDIKDKHDRTIAESRQPAIFMYEAHVKQGPDDVSVSRSNLVAILVPVALVVVALSAALVFFIVRHKRLQRSFLAFANSHYNIQSGTTTFSDDLDGDEPLIQGFSDDEPLVIA